MKTLHAFSILSALVLMACACHQEDISDSFKEDDSLRIEIKGYTTFRYDPLTCQLSFNRERNEFRVHSDNMSDFFSLVLDDFPSGEGQSIDGNVSWTTGSNLHNKKTTFEVLKLEGDTVWLWSSRNRIALVVRALR